jgi:CoA-disulfide reductase
MSNKIIIVGGVAGGASAAARLRRLDEDAEIIIFERGDHISFANCGLPYHIGGVIEEREKLLVQTPEAMEDRFDISVKVKHEVIDINRQKNEVKVKNIKTGEEFCESYDNLILSPGADPVQPPLPGLDGDNVFTLRNIPDTDEIKGYVDNKKPEKAVVVGGGFIGLEMAENLQERGLDVSLVEMMDQVMASLDCEMAAMIHNHLRSNGINLHLNDGLDKVEHTSGKSNVILQSGEIIAADMIILAIGVSPNTELAKKADLEIGETGGIKVDKKLRTSGEDIYAIGDVIEVEHFVTGEAVHIPLAGPANKQGRIVSGNICGRDKEYKGTQGTAIAKVFDLAVGSTGSSEKQLKEAGIDYQVSYTVSKNHAGYYPGAVPMTVKIIFTPKEGRLLGAQIVGYDGVSKRTDIFATAIRHNEDVIDLQELELAYAPPFGSAKDPVNMAGFAAGNIINDMVEPIQWHEVDQLDEEDGVQLLDVREKIETKLGMIEGATNIPLNSLRDRLNTLDKEKEIIVYCAVGLRGYIACRILKQNGFENVKNLSGGYKLYSAVRDDKNENQISEREDQMGSVSNPEEGKQLKEKLNKNNNVVSVDACGLQCPGPIMQVYKKSEELNDGDILEVTATDPGFKKDVAAWCDSTGNTLLSVDQSDGQIKALIRKGREEAATSDKAVVEQKNGKTMVVFSGELDRAIASFIIANGATSMGSNVTLFFTFWGLNILRKNQYVDVEKNSTEKMFSKMMPRGSKKLPLSNMNMFGMGPKMIRKVMEDKNVDSLETLIGQAKLNGVRLVACQMSMDLMGIKKEELIDGVEVGGVATFLNAADESNMSLFI